MKQSHIYIQHIIFLLIALTTLLSGCANNSDTKAALDRADRIIDYDTENAMKILDSIKNTNISGEENIARHGLLSFMSLIKTGEIPKSDSLLQQAMVYYLPSTQPSREKMLTQFYKAAYLDLTGHSGAAVKYYADAISTGDKISDNLYTGMAMSNTGVIYALDNLGSEELDYTKAGLERLILSNDTPKIIHGYEQYAIACIHNAKYDDAYNTANEAIKISRAIKDTTNTSLLKLIIAESMVYSGNFKSALDKYTEVLSTPELFSNNDYMLMSLALIGEQRFNEAEAYINALTDNLDSDMDKLRWFTLRSNLSKATGNYQEGVVMTDSIISFANGIMDNILRRSILHEERDEYERENASLSKISEQKSLIIKLSIACGITLCVLLSFIYFFVFMQMKKKMALQSKRIELRTKRLIEVRTDYKEKTESYLKEKTSLCNSLDNTSKMLTESKDMLLEKEKRMESLLASTIQAIHTYYSTASKILITEPKNADKKSKLLLEKQCAILIDELSSSSSLKKMESSLNELFNSIVSKIECEFNINSRDKKILVLSLCGFNYKAIARILDENPTTTSSAKSRLFRKILEANSPNHNLYHRHLSPRTH